MGDFLAPAYDWIRALHVISVIFWMAGMFMLPRYFAYHTEVETGSAADQRWQERERRLLRIIINPSMIAAWIFGLMLIAIIGFGGLWLHVKLALVLALSALHGMLARWRKDFASGRNSKSAKFYRMVNEVPTVSVIVIVILVVVKPF